MKSWGARTLVKGALVFLLLLICLLLVLYLFFSSLMGWVLTEVNSSFPGRIIAKSWSLGTSSVTAKEIKLYSPEDELLLESDSVNLSWEWGELYQSANLHAVKEIQLEKPQFFLTIDPQGVVNWSSLSTQEESGDPDLLTNWSARVLVEEGDLTITDQNYSGALVELKELDVEIELTAQEPARFTLDGEMVHEQDRGAIEIVGKWDLGRPGLQLAYDLKDLPLASTPRLAGKEAPLYLEKGFVDLKGYTRMAGQDWEQAAKNLVVDGDWSLKEVEGWVGLSGLVLPFEGLSAKGELDAQSLKGEVLGGSFMGATLGGQTYLRWEPNLLSEGSLTWNGFDVEPLMFQMGTRYPEIAKNKPWKVELSGESSWEYRDGQKWWVALKSFADEAQVKDRTIDHILVDLQAFPGKVQIRKAEVEGPEGYLGAKGWVFFEPLRFQGEVDSTFELGDWLQDSDGSGSVSGRVFFSERSGLTTWGHGSGLDLARLKGEQVGVSDLSGDFLFHDDLTLWKNLRAYWRGEDLRSSFGSFDLRSQDLFLGFSSPQFSLQSLSSFFPEPLPYQLEGDLRGVFEGNLKELDHSSLLLSLTDARANLFDQNLEKVDLSFALYNKRALGQFSSDIGGAKIKGGALFESDAQRGDYYADVENLGSLLSSDFQGIQLKTSGRYEEGRLTGFAKAFQGEKEKLYTRYEHGRDGLYAMSWLDWGGDRLPQALAATDLPLEKMRLLGEMAIYPRDSGTGAIYHGVLADPESKESPEMVLSGVAMYDEGDLHLWENILRWKGLEERVNPYRNGEHYTYYTGHYPNFEKPPFVTAKIDKVVKEVPNRGVGVAKLSGLLFNADKELALNYRASNVPFGWLAHQPLIEGRSFNEMMSFDIVTSLGRAKGVMVGDWEQPYLGGVVEAPWALVSRSEKEIEGDFLRQQAYALSSDLHYSGGLLAFENVHLSDTANDSRIKNTDKEVTGEGLFRLSGWVDLREEVPYLTLNTQAAQFKLSAFAPMVPESYRSFLPEGLVSSTDLSFIGPLNQLSAKGSLWVEHGRIYKDDRGSLNFKEFSLNFRPSEEGLAIEKILFDTGEEQIRGDLRRNLSGGWEGKIYSHSIPAAILLNPLSKVSEVHGQVAFVAEIEDHRGDTWVKTALQGEELYYLPSHEEKKVGPFSLKVGQLKQEGEDLAIEVASLFALEGDELVVNLGDEGVDWTLSGREDEPDSRLVLSGEMGMKIPGSSDLLGWLKGPDGPIFGSKEKPLALDFYHLNGKLKSLLSRGPWDLYDWDTSGRLEFLGQWHDGHKDENENPFSVTLKLDELRMDTGIGEEKSGVLLQKPTLLAYERKGEEMVVENLDLGLDVYRKDPSIAENLEGFISLEGNLALASLNQLSGSDLQASFIAVPIQNLGLVLPKNLGLQGSIDFLQLSLEGPLHSPLSSVIGQASQALWSGIDIAEVAIGLHTKPRQEGGIAFSLSGPNKEISELYLGEEPTEKHRVWVTGEVEIPFPEEKDHLLGMRYFWQDRFVNYRASQLDTHLKANDEDLYLMGAIFPGDEVTSGTLRSELSLKGTLAKPVVEGFFNIKDGNYQSRWIENGLKNLEVVTKFNPIVSRSEDSSLATSWTIDKFQANLGDSLLSVRGGASYYEWGDWTSNVEVEGRDLHLIVQDLFDGKISLYASFQDDLQKDLRALKTQGKLTLHQGNITIPSWLLDSFDEEGESQEDSWTKKFLDYRLKVELQDQVWVNFLDSYVRGQGEVEIRRDETLSPEVWGHLALSRGKVNVPFYDSNFRLTQGDIYWDGAMIPRLENVEAFTRVETYSISAQIEGTYPDINMAFITDPPFALTDINRTLQLGGLPQIYSGWRTAVGNSLDFDDSFLAGQGTSFLTSLLTNRITENLSKNLLLSEVALRYEPPDQYMIRIAKALDPRDKFLFTLSYETATLGGDITYGFEWRMGRNTLFRFGRSDKGDMTSWFQTFLRFW